MRQGDLFSHDPPRRYPSSPGHRGVDTSRAAARSIEPHIGDQHKRILRFLAERAGAIRDEIEIGCRLSTPSACGRLRELELKGLVIKSPDKRLGESGRECRVYKITEAGRAAA